MQISEYKNIYDNEGSHFFYTSTHELILSLVSKFKPKGEQIKILDAGCGTGLLAKKLDKFGEVYAIDESAEAIKFSKKRGLKNLKRASVDNIPFKNSSFDIITCMDVIYHKGVDDQRAIDEFSRVLKPGGIIILKAPAFNWLKGSHDIVVETRKRYTINELKKLIRNADLQIIKASYFFMFLFPFVALRRVMDKFRSSHSSEIGRMPKSVNLILDKIIKLESKLLQKVNLPFGVSAIVIAKKFYLK